MIYRDFETIPYKVLVKVNETSNYSLLTDEQGISTAYLQDVWDSIYAEYSIHNKDPEEDRIFRIEREISHFEAGYKIIMIGCEILKFAYNQDVADSFETYGYYIDENNFLDRIEQIEREAEGLLIKADSYREGLPRQEEGQIVTVDDILASYCAILQIDFDFNTVTASKVVALGKQIDKKIKASLTNNQ